MKTYKVIISLLCVLITFPAVAQTAMSDTTINAVRVKELTLRKCSIEKQIKIEDSKRNQIINGVSVETQETLNDQQDSICLALRSQLVSVELELKELIPDRTVEAIVNQFNKLQQNAQSESCASYNDDNDKK